MSDSIITVENLSKKYVISHKQEQYYTAMRDVLVNGAKNIGKKLLRKQVGSTSKEDFWALKDINFEIKQGDRVGIIGRNGAGKSTLLKILSRITEPTTGKIHLRGRVASLLEVGTGFHPELTGRENIYLNGAIMGMSKSEIKKKFDEIVDFAEVEKFLDTPVKRYSSGMYVRLAFAVAAHLEPEILIVDEVLAVGDAQFQKKCLGKMEGVSKDGRVVIFVSHDIAAVKRLCKRGFLLHNGRLQVDSTSGNVIQTYTQLSQKDFLGSFKRKISQDSIHIKEVKFIDENNIFVSNKINYQEKLIILVKVDGKVVNKHFSLEFRIYSAQQELISMGASGAFHNLYFDRDVKEVKITIPHMIFTNGNYRISFSIMDGNVRQDIWDDGVFFTIVNCEPFRPGFELNDACVVLQHSYD